ncbi:MAG: hypothetical protein P5702_21925 [Limnospira sp. PMC 1291.21]|uniref:Uncharacterized protein n=1 Tax=Limnospira indica PCC 8005 TaxID=376219 RepID=A0A9P1KJY4_9CYAN|nr:MULTISPECIES: hypothetical protein [Limnospira]MDT9180240.1 hypothetical protein [Limnospira sp. PMC 1238.20]MDT9282454.1 hypothetical protein [Limnospira sp. PMC 1293.21]CDM97492.1 conserved protein of unknown function [Limnospira indica PCC 8005]MDT9201185.1 hypothetical protein [Limnospira sp. PMC 1042.18]MDT9236432.1 hypothetical protein [Limnospira sp. PMC 917.15]
MSDPNSPRSVISITSDAATGQLNLSESLTPEEVFAYLSLISKMLEYTPDELEEILWKHQTEERFRSPILPFPTQQNPSF